MLELGEDVQVEAREPVVVSLSQRRRDCVSEVAESQWREQSQVRTQPSRKVEEGKRSHLVDADAGKATRGDSRLGARRCRF